MSPSDERYTSVAIVLHWSIAIAVAVQAALGWLMQDIPKQPPGPRVDAFNLHKSIGLTLLALMILRLLWRYAHRPPALPPMPAWQRRAAQGNHALLHALLVLLPLSGYLGSVFSGYPVRFFGVVLPSWGGKSEPVKSAMSGAHEVLAWLLVAAVALHVAAALKHALVEHDGTLSRMGIGRRERRAGAGPVRTSPPPRR